ncbi:MAG: hypothetical protein JSS86_01275 [Cyanobacteria bacterium SZAS LIN-2]|nr:hypothetical protein [Cyanobacteria bacterium SZAS LIN-3]MBS1994903.1 hypothetical protein [Cyanobacteria bacterium SZAS LIN-2]
MTPITTLTQKAEKTTPSLGQPWLSSPTWDTTWILGPALISASCALIFKEQMEACQSVPLWVWVCFILMVDVAHVYASLFRTYLDPKAFSKNKVVLLVMPVVAWLGGTVLYWIGDQYFWRGLVYLAVFHFIRQQFGFMMLYGRRDSAAAKKYRWLDHTAIYTATVYPLLFWHTHVRDFSWFGATEFFDCVPAFVNEIGFAAYVLVAAAYFSKEIFLAKQGQINIPKNLLLLTTAYSWWTCIVAVNSDLAFTITNVVSHGVPYMALVWLYHGRAAREKEMSAPGAVSAWGRGWRKLLISNAFIFVASMVLLAYIEEGFWDSLVWREHWAVFAPFWRIPHQADPLLLAIIVPFLALPQSTHYLLDGLIWKVKERGSVWSA